MKKNLFIAGILFICMIPISLFAENEAIDKGSFEFGLGTVFDLTLYKGNYEANEFAIGSGLSRFNFGYFIVNRLSIGGAAYYYSFKYEGDTESTTEFMIGPYFSYYIPITERFLADITGVFQFNSWEYPGDVDRTSRMWFGGGGGITFLVTSNLGLKGGFGILYSPNYKDEGTEVEDTSYTQIIIGLGFTVYI
jgi:hypothetical protein